MIGTRGNDGRSRNITNEKYGLKRRVPFEEDHRKDFGIMGRVTDLVSPMSYFLIT